MNYCEDCGCAIYNGHCVNCHEEIYIYEQHAELGTLNTLSDEFIDKVMQQSANPSTPIKPNL
ncbi:MAG TPA: hypothetical protein VN922_16645 [Bacteroidia bacterium]|nr:hypothetical protein [Bacteroidia bacterium]